MSVQKAISGKINSMKGGTVVRPASFAHLGSRSSVDQALSRLAKSGQIERVQQGIYVKPGRGRHVARALPRAEQIARSIAASNGKPVQVHGAEAARRLGLSTQQPAETVLLTTGLSKPRRIRVGSSVAELRPASERRLILAGRPAGTALSALWYLGKEEVTPEVVNTIRRKLPPEEFKALFARRTELPQWMREALEGHQKAWMHERSLPETAA